MRPTKEQMIQILQELSNPQDGFLPEEKIQEIAEKYEREILTKTSQEKSADA